MRFINNFDFEVNDVSNYDKYILFIYILLVANKLLAALKWCNFNDCFGVHVYATNNCVVCTIFFKKPYVFNFFYFLLI